MHLPVPDRRTSPVGILIATLLVVVASGPAFGQAGYESAAGGDPSSPVAVDGLPPQGDGPAEDSAPPRPEYPPDVDPWTQAIPTTHQVDLGGAVDAPAITRSFQGITDTGSFPPDPVLAAGPSYLVACVNRHVAFFTKAGQKLYDSHFATFFSPLGTSGWSLFDPWVVYDPHANRFIILIVAKRDSTQQDYNFLAISKTSSPMGGWYFYKNNMGVNGSTPTSNWGDYPRLAVDKNAIYITANMFQFGGGFQYAKVRVIQNKSTLVNGGSGQTWWDFWNITRPGSSSKAATLQPCLTYDSTSSTGPFFLVDAYQGGGSKINFYAITNVTRRTPTGPDFSSVALSVGTYASPSNATQKGGVETIELFRGSQLFNAVKRNGSIWTAHPVKGGTGGAELRWYEFKVNSWPTSGSPTKVQEGTFGLGSSSWYFYPTVAVNANNDAAFVFNRSSASEYVGVRYTVRRASDAPNLLQASVQLKAGEAYYVRKASGRNRWGDYSAASADPADGTVWMVAEYARPSNKWATWIGQVFDPEPRFLVTSFGGTAGSKVLGLDASGNVVRTVTLPAGVNSPDAIVMGSQNNRVHVFDTDRVFRYYLATGNVYQSTLRKYSAGDEVTWGDVDEDGGLVWCTAEGAIYKSASEFPTASNTGLLRRDAATHYNAIAWNGAAGGYVAVGAGGQIRFLSRTGTVVRTVAGPANLSGIDWNPFDGNFYLTRFGLATERSLLRLTPAGSLVSFGPVGAAALYTANAVECREQTSSLLYGVEAGGDPQHVFRAADSGIVVSAVHTSSGLMVPSDLELSRQRPLWATGALRPGQTTSLSLDFGPARAGDAYQMAMALDYKGGIPVGAGVVHLPAGDPFLIPSILGADGGTVWKRFAGFLGATGAASPSPQVAVPNVPRLAGLRVYFGAVTYNPLSGITAASNAFGATIQ